MIKFSEAVWKSIIDDINRKFSFTTQLQLYLWIENIFKENENYKIIGGLML
jgi:hypothetical protein